MSHARAYAALRGACGSHRNPSAEASHCSPSEQATAAGFSSIRALELTLNRLLGNSGHRARCRARPLCRGGVGGGGGCGVLRVAAKP